MAANLFNEAFKPVAESSLRQGKIDVKEVEHVEVVGPDDEEIIFGCNIHFLFIHTIGNRHSFQVTDVIATLSRMEFGTVVGERIKTVYAVDTETVDSGVNHLRLVFDQSGAAKMLVRPRKEYVFSFRKLFFLRCPKPFENWECEVRGYRGRQGTLRRRRSTRRGFQWWWGRATGGSKFAILASTFVRQGSIGVIQTLRAQGLNPTLGEGCRRLTFARSKHKEATSYANGACIHEHVEIVQGHGRPQNNGIVYF
ncbi:hypothetical protein SARC_02695 [Sphaeroforma arctica JP610]|uniref:Uncharacterized protein n=1 Tax=Sphaeroforma arctica JP610 TaxID=667725 RepID=A0A0L0G7Z7_9EUKA|nr:hypothetical protein SARC_02695 [Sphaeroforma arctica JP610]KNC85105.1 hypothetical protein SARC_02695 [Sphaeroforma arctica JP610]|eukprot:XP_014159007.1 hypothetical protein SARC_02695 [Sphaeroforma arctica JP610]